MRALKIQKKGSRFILYYNDRTIKLSPKDSLVKIWEKMDKIDLLEDNIK